jgi:polysaccharide biosynthesis protein PslH
MMRAMGALGVRVSLATVGPSPAEALVGLSLSEHADLDDLAEGSNPNQLELGPIEERFRSYWGVPLAHISAFAQLAEDVAADAVVVSGLDVLPLLAGVRRGVRVWYAADEWVWHHLSQVTLSDWASWTNVKDAATKGLYERAFRRRVDRAWAVSPADTRALRVVAGIRHVDTVPNGVDTAAYPSTPGREHANTAIFWGRLDFGPNIQALEFFVERVWPEIRARRPDARFTIAGFKPDPLVRVLASAPGIEIFADVADIPALVGHHAVVVLPFQSGGGIKNKLLEAASMSKAIVASPRATKGLKGSPPLLVARTPGEWASTLFGLWDDPDLRTRLGASAREWVTREHTWDAAARCAIIGIEDSIRRNRPR